MEGELDRDMTPRLVKDLGMGYPTPKSTKKYRCGLYECQYCGKEFEAGTSSVKRNDTRSCGCLHKSRIKTHGLSKHRLYNTWTLMLDRCNNPNSKIYKNYGGRGITIYQEWLNLENFLAWCDKTYIEGLTLDRINNDLGYHPDNCRWVTKSEQAINRRMKGINTSGYTGVSYHKTKNKWTANIGINNKLKHLGQFDSIEEAVQARDNYITQNSLPHKLSTDYKREDS